MLDTSTPEYKEEDIRSIIEHLYLVKDSDAKEMVNEICEIYGKRGVWRICRDIFEKNNLSS